MASKRVLSAILSDIIRALESDRVAEVLVDQEFATHNEYSFQTLKAVS